MEIVLKGYLADHGIQILRQVGEEDVYKRQLYGALMAIAAYVRTGSLYTSGKV